jgi:hypothetical protein
MVKSWVALGMIQVQFLPMPEYTSFRNTSLLLNSESLQKGVL